MKRLFFILFIGVIGIALMLLLRPKSPASIEQTVLQPTPTNAAKNMVTKLEATHATAGTETQIPPTIITLSEPKKSLDATTAQSIADWTNAVPNLKVWNHFRNENSWIVDQKDTNNYPALLLKGMNGDGVQFAAKLTDVETVGDHIRRVELQSGWMNIADTRPMGDSLLQMMGKNQASFDDWCDKVGNNWVDAPLYSSGSSQVPDSNKFYGFQMLRSYNNEKPWVIYFIITDK